MTTKRFKLASKAFFYSGKDAAIKGYYQSWRSINQATKKPFAALFSSFKDEHLKTLEGGPLRLYLFFSFAADNQTGHSWHSIKSIADYFETQTRTINNWIQVLVEKDLIYREQTNKKSHTTYLIPYSNTWIKHSPPTKVDKDEQKSLDTLVNQIESLSPIYGDIVRVYHLFQWRMKNYSLNPDDSFQALFIITRRKNGILVGHRYDLNHSEHLSISELNIEDISLFNSPFLYKEESIKGLALPHDIPIERKANSDALLDLMKDLVESEEWELDEQPKVQYGQKDDVLSLDSEKDKENGNSMENNTPGD